MCEPIEESPNCPNCGHAWPAHGRTISATCIAHELDGWAICSCTALPPNPLLWARLVAWWRR